jgi:hypothetical protein
MERYIESEHQRKTLIRFIEAQSIPFTAKVVKGKRPRTLEQNKLQRMWCKEISEQMEGHTPEEVRGYCKLHFGVPILRRDSADYKLVYDEMVKPMPYQRKLAYMMEPFDFAVTRVMTTSQLSEYLDIIYKHFSELGVQLTRPEGDAYGEGQP